MFRFDVPELRDRDYETWGMSKTFYIGESISAIAIKTFQNLLEETGTEHKLYLYSSLF